MSRARVPDVDLSWLPDGHRVVLDTIADTEGELVQVARYAWRREDGRWLSTGIDWRTAWRRQLTSRTPYTWSTLEQAVRAKAEAIAANAAAMEALVAGGERHSIGQLTRFHQEQATWLESLELIAILQIAIAVPPNALPVDDGLPGWPL